MPLTAKQRTFINNYLISKNATEAAKAAGYSPKTARIIGTENLAKPEIKKEIEKGLSKQAIRADITAERVINRIAEFAFDKKEIKASDTIKANELLAKHFKLLTDVQETTGKDGGPIVILTIPANGSEADGSDKS